MVTILSRWMMDRRLMAKDLEEKKRSRDWTRQTGRVATAHRIQISWEGEKLSN